MELKKCTKCGLEFPNSTEYFYKREHGRLATRCKKCFNEKNNKNILNRYKSDELFKQRRKDNALKYYYEHKEKVLLRQKENPSKYIYSDRFKKMKYIRECRRKAKAKKLEGNLTLDQWNQIKEYFGNKCAYCGKEGKLTQDHFIPISKNGEYTHNNIIPACISCNSSKHNKDFSEWYPKQKVYSQKRELKIYRYLCYNIETKTQQLSMIV